jgi:hypothetical protein
MPPPVPPPVSSPAAHPYAEWGRLVGWDTAEEGGEARTAADARGGEEGGADEAGAASASLASLDLVEKSAIEKMVRRMKYLSHTHLHSPI